MGNSSRHTIHSRAEHLMENAAPSKTTEQHSGRYVSLLTKNTFAMILAGGRGRRPVLVRR